MRALRPVALRPVALIAFAALAGCSPQLAPAQAGPAASERARASEALDIVRANAIPLGPDESGHDRLIASIGDSTRVLLGESTHGTSEYYRERARITLRLVREGGVKAVAIEGDWSPTYRANLYVRGLGNDRDARQALQDFTRFPSWMWPNREFAQFMEELRQHNLSQPGAQRVGLYGMDVYDLFEAADSVIAYLGRQSSEESARARANYRCFSFYGRNTHTYGAAAQDPRRSCQEEAAAVAAQVTRLARPSDPAAAEAHFAAVRAAASAVAAEEYFRIVYASQNAWNVRDRRMEATVEAIAEHVQRRSGQPAKLVMWSHNTHSGDARATFAAEQGELNLGQLMRQRHGDKAYLVGFFTNGGTVLAAPAWDEPGKVFDLRPAREESISGLFHQAGLTAFALLLKDDPRLPKAFSTPMLERAVGVIYVRDRERTAHYFNAVLSEQFDAALFYDRTAAVSPL